jgi:hypothetical protein
VPEPVDLGILTRINNDHGVTRDGKMLVPAHFTRREVDGVPHV